MRHVVLIIDDSPADANRLRRLLDKIPGRSFDIDTCADPDAVDAHFEDAAPEIVFVDYLLGSVTGVEIIERLRASGILSAFVLQTGHGNEAVATEALRAGAYDYLIKDDLTPEILNRSIRYTSQRFEMENELRRHRDHLDALVQEKTAEISRLSQAVEQSPVSVQIADRDGQVVYVNPRFLEMSDRRYEEVIGQPLNSLDCRNAPEAETQNIWATVASGKVWRGVFRRTQKCGLTCWEREALAPVRDADGVISHYVSITEDITEERRLREELSERSIRLEKALREEKKFNNLQRQFISMVSHEFRTPMAIIDGAAQALLRRRDKMPPELISGRLEIVREAIGRMNSLIVSALNTASGSVWNPGTTSESGDARPGRGDSPASSDSPFPETDPAMAAGEGRVLLETDERTPEQIPVNSVLS